MNIGDSQKYRAVKICLWLFVIEGWQMAYSVLVLLNNDGNYNSFDSRLLSQCSVKILVIAEGSENEHERIWIQRLIYLD